MFHYTPAWLPKRILWWMLAGVLGIAGATAYSVKVDWLGWDGGWTVLFWACVTLAWGCGYALLTLGPHRRPEYDMVVRYGLWFLNPVTAFIGGWMFAGVLWIALAVLLFALREDVFGWKSVGERPPELDL